jgi:hypothetical protein
MFAAGAAPRRPLTRTVESLLRNLTRSFVLVLALASFAQYARAQAGDADGKAAIAVADSVLAALTSGDNATLARLTLDSSVVGGVGTRDGVERLSLRTWGLYINRTAPSTFTERGFDPTARVQDRVAQVWVPYDLYIGDKWSHCGVDAFTLIKSEGRWRVAALIYTIEQPPACRKHPAGPPGH